MMPFTLAGARLAAPILFAFFAVSAVAPAHAAGDDTSTPTCAKGEAWDSKAGKCVKRNASALPDEDLANYAYALTQEGRFAEAIEVLDTLQQPKTAKALNYRGYATRKMGKTEEGIGYYLQSVALDPRYAQVREYLGEAYVIQGKVDLAREQLKIIEGLCGTQCEEYEDLAEAIEKPSSL